MLRDEFSLDPAALKGLGLITGQISRSILIGLLFGLVLGAVIQNIFLGLCIGAGYGAVLGILSLLRQPRWLQPTILGLCIIITAVVTWDPVKVLIQRERGLRLDRRFLVEDIRQLASILESAHPDPYYHGGGKLAFHRRMQNLICSVPENGLTATEFYELLRPFMAAVGDGHTNLMTPSRQNTANRGAIPLYFKVIEKKLYVSGVMDSAHLDLLGSVLVSVEGVEVSDLLLRQSQLRGCDNEFQVLRNLGYDGSLWQQADLRQILPEWRDTSRIQLVLHTPGFEPRAYSLPVTGSTKEQLLVPQTRLQLPSTAKSDYAYKWLDTEKKTVLLLLENMYAYRESFEMGQSIGGDQRHSLAKYLYERANDRSAPQSYTDIVAGIPSITELCRELVQVMRENQSENLIVDLRRNQGGNAFISTIFYYFFYGKEAMIDFGEKRSILVKKYSPYFWDTYPNRNLADINQHQPLELLPDDYDFSGHPEPGYQFSREETIRLIEEEVILSPTFWNEFQSEEYSGYYRPPNIIILCTPMTTSSGYAFMYDHYTAGALVVGTPSSQAGNNFGAWLGFELQNSGIFGHVSHLWITHFPDDPEMGKVFQPHQLLTYDRLRSYDFDPNSEILFALDLLQQNGSTLHPNP